MMLIYLPIFGWLYLSIFCYLMAEKTHISLSNLICTKGISMLLIFGSTDQSVDFVVCTWSLKKKHIALMELSAERLVKSDA